MKLEIINALESPERLLPFFEDYHKFLMEKDPQLRKFLIMQSYDDETEHLHEKYGEGGIYIVNVDGKDVGCIAFKKLDETTCEVKRVFLYDECRGLGIGRRMMDRIITDARAKGYKTMLLDTLPNLTDALGLYEKIGFKPTEKYNDNPLDYAIFLKLEL